VGVITLFKAAGKARGFVLLIWAVQQRPIQNNEWASQSAGAAGLFKFGCSYLHEPQQFAVLFGIAAMGVWVSFLEKAYYPGVVVSLAPTICNMTYIMASSSIGCVG
jgi:hypothetical protein